MPRRWPIPSEKRPARRRTTRPRPTRSTTSSTRERAMPPVRLAVHGCRPAGRRVQPQDQPHGGRLPGAVRAQEPRDPARLHHKAQVLDRDLVPIAFGQPVHLDHVAHLSHASDGRRLDRLARRQVWSAHGHATVPGQAGHRTMRLDPGAEASDVSPRDPSAGPLPDGQRVVQRSHADLGPVLVVGSRQPGRGSPEPAAIRRCPVELPPRSGRAATPGGHGSVADGDLQGGPGQQAGRVQGGERRDLGRHQQWNLGADQRDRVTAA